MNGGRRGYETCRYLKPVMRSLAADDTKYRTKRYVSVVASPHTSIVEQSTDTGKRDLIQVQKRPTAHARLRVVVWSLE